MPNNELENLIIGYYSDALNDGEKAAKHFSDFHFGSEKQTYIQYNEPKCLFKALASGKIDYAVAPFENSVTGEIHYVEKALVNKPIHRECITELPVHLCLFINKITNIDNVEVIAADPELLKQTKMFRKYNYRECEAVNYPGITAAPFGVSIPQDPMFDIVAVICREELGKQFDLKLIKRNCEDSKDCVTSYGLYKKEIHTP